METIFKRVEQKYILNEKEYKQINEMINKYFTKDKYYKTKIYNIYYDNDNNDLLITSLEKPLYKEKVRVRKYDGSNDIFLEKKIKYKGTVYKRREVLNEKEYNNYINKNILPKNNSQIIKEIDYTIKNNNLHPYMFLSYERYSYVSLSDKNFRLTFDYNLKSRLNNLSLNNTIEDIEYFKDKMYIMEVKSNNSLPIWFIKELSKLKIYPHSFSKIGKIYERGVLC